MRTEDNSVVQEWLAEQCTFKMQTVLLTSFRGCDGTHKHDLGKDYTRLMRATVLKNADPNTTFFPTGEAVQNAYEVQQCFFDDMDHYPVHWFMHLLHAAEICGYKCPDKGMRDFWLNFYCHGCHELHVNRETEDQMELRLRDNK